MTDQADRGRKPRRATWESWVEQQIRAGMERGEFVRLRCRNFQDSSHSNPRRADRFAEEQSIDLAQADEELNDSQHTIANDLLESTLR